MRVHFAIVGAQKCGTSALAAFLGQHPEICMAPAKEVHFFDSAAERLTPPEKRDIAYHAEFPNYTGQPIVGEATPVYMFLPHVPPRMRSYNPDFKLICLLRDPADRALSHYAMSVAKGLEHRGPVAAFLLEGPRLLCSRPEDIGPDKPWRCHSYRARGLYSHQIVRLLRYFPRKQLLVLTQEELREHHAETLVRVFRFLGVRDESFIPQKENVFVTAKPAEVPAWLHRILRASFRPEIRRLERLLDRPFPHWCR